VPREYPLAPRFRELLRRRLYQNGKQSIYVDGVLVNEVDMTLTTLDASNIFASQTSTFARGPYVIGQQSKSDRQATRFAKLQLAEIVVWDTLLTSDEAATLTANLRAKYCLP